MIKFQSHKDLDTYKLAFESSMTIFELTKKFPKEERYALTDQIRRSSRSVCANIAEAYRKRKYPRSFVSKLSDSESEAAETQTWLDFSRECRYISETSHCDLLNTYELIIGKLVKMAASPEKWNNKP